MANFYPQNSIRSQGEGMQEKNDGDCRWCCSGRRLFASCEFLGSENTSQVLINVMRVR
jgi:hypothetical protein